MYYVILYFVRNDDIKMFNQSISLGIQVRAEDGDHEMVRLVKQSRYPWLSGGHAVVICFMSW